MARSLPELAEAGLIDAGWAGALEPVAPDIAALGERLRAEVAAGRRYLPAGDHVLRAFQRPLADVRVLIVGQDPYPTPGHPIGLSFAVERARAAAAAEPLEHLPGAERRSRHPARTARRPVGVERSGRHAAQQGAHGRARGTRHPIAAGGGRRSPSTRSASSSPAAEPLVAILWGRDAANLRPLLGSTPIIESAHPSPLSASRGFFGSRPFSRANDLLEQQGAAPVDWRVPA